MKRALFALFFAVFVPFSTAQTPFLDTVGIYAWGQLRAGAGDPLAAAADDIAGLGARNFRTTIAPYWDPRGVEDYAPLAEKIQRADYAYAIRKFRTVMLTAYDTASFDAASGNPLYRVPIGAAPRPARRRALSAWRRSRPLEAAQTREQWEQVLRNVEREFYDFAYELSKIPDVKFYVGNWEAENDGLLWDQYIEYVQARLVGTIRGREAASRDGYPAQVFTAFEFRSLDAGAGFDAAMHRLGGVEFLSLSSWYFTDYGGASRSRFEQAFQSMRQGCQDAGVPCRILIGEVGYLRDLDPENRNLKETLTACLDLGALAVFNWVAYDQPGEGITVDGVFYDQSQWGKWDSTGSLTTQGAAFGEWFLNGLQ